MNIQNNIGKYLVGAVAGVALVVGCGGGGGVVNSVAASSTTGVNAQLFCSGSAADMVTANNASANIFCLSSTSPTQLTFHDFYEITQQGWVLAQISATNGSPAFIFYK
jgi:hypothetical protein